jgi:hypothetical protein
VERVGRELGRVALGGAQPSKLLRDRLGADPRRVEQGRLAEQAHGGAAGRHHRATAARVEAGILDRPVGAVGVDGERDADDVPARGSAGGAGEGVNGGVPAGQRTFKVVDQLLARAHPSECKARRAALR